MNAYEQKKQAKIDRLAARAETAAKQANELWERGKIVKANETTKKASYYARGQHNRL